MRVNPEYYRPVENENLLGSAAKSKAAFGWEPKYTLESLVEEMVLSDIELTKSGKMFSTTNLDWLIDRAAEEREITSAINSAPSSTAGDTYKASDGWSTSGVEGSEQTTECSSVTEGTDIPGPEKVDLVPAVGVEEDVNSVVIEGLGKIDAENTGLTLNEKDNGHSDVIPSGEITVTAPFVNPEPIKTERSVSVEPATPSPSTVAESETTVNLSITIDGEGRVTKVYNVPDFTVEEKVTLPTAVTA